MITQDYLNINNGKAFPVSATFTHKELNRLDNFNFRLYHVWIEKTPEPYKYRATSVKALLKILKAEFVEGTKIEIREKQSIFKGDFTI